MVENKANNSFGGYSKRYARDESEISKTSSISQEMSHFLQPPKKNPLKYFVSFFGVMIIVFFILGGLFINGELDPKKISVKEFSEGTNLELKKDNHVKFKFEEEYHGIQVDSVKLDSVEITIRSEPIKLNLKINELQEVDIDNDSIKDITVKLIQIVDGKATIAVRKIEQNRCVENWKCGEWADCEKGKQERECTDLNECGGDFGIPPEKKRCLEMEFVNWDDPKNSSMPENKTELINLAIEEINKTDNISYEEREEYLKNQAELDDINLNDTLENETEVDDIELNESLYDEKMDDPFLSNSPGEEEVAGNITLNDTLENKTEIDDDEPSDNLGWNSLGIDQE